MEPHQRLKAAGKLITVSELWEKQDEAVVFFFSHQWTSDMEPDHSGSQLLLLQDTLRRMAAGKMPPITATFSATAQGLRFPSLSTAESRRLTLRAFIWIDYISVPQPDVEEDVEQRAVTAEQMKEAILSIPAYIKLSTVFMLVCPPVEHRDTHTLCNVGSWLSRSWCRLEALALLLQVGTNTPAIIVRSHGATPVLLDPSGAAGLEPTRPSMSQHMGGPAAQLTSVPCPA